MTDLPACSLLPIPGEAAGRKGVWAYIEGGMGKVRHTTTSRYMLLMRPLTDPSAICCIYSSPPPPATWHCMTGVCRHRGECEGEGRRGGDACEREAHPA